MNIESLFNGIAVIVDDEINDTSSSIYTIKRLLEGRNIPVLTFPEVPTLEMVPALGGTTFVILDWDYTYDNLPLENEERIFTLNVLRDEETQRLISFITRLIEESFVPVFIFTHQSKDMVISKLVEAGLYQDGKSNRIFVREKDEVNTDSDLFSAIAEWFRNMPSVYVLKEWAAVFQKAQNNTFNELYKYSTNWAGIMFNALKKDSIDYQQEFGSFVTKSILNRIDNYAFDEELLEIAEGYEDEELRRVIESERFLSYSDSYQPEQAYTGDLFKYKGAYHLNIRAQCAISRIKDGTYDPVLYCIKGSRVGEDRIASKDIHFNNEKALVISNSVRYNLDEINKIYNNEEELAELNRDIENKLKKRILLREGTFLEKENIIIICCIAGELALEFNISDIEQKNYSEIKDKRIGRVLPPYITRIQQKAASFMVREGVIRLPEELFAIE